MTIQVRTPPGKATGTSNLIKRILIGNARADYVASPADDLITWHVTCDPRHYSRIARNVGSYSGLVRAMLDNSMVKKFGVSQLSVADQALLKEMLLNQTKIEIIKGSSPVSLDPRKALDS